MNAAFYQAVASRIDMAPGPAGPAAANPVTRRSEFDRLKDVAKAASLASSSSGSNCWPISTPSG